MQLQTIIDIESTMRIYTDNFTIENNLETLNVFISAEIGEEDKELFLDNLDGNLPLGIIFTHEYKNGKLKVIFKEVEIEF